jgi:hypothetical protein
MSILKDDEMRMERIRAYFLSETEAGHHLDEKDAKILDRWKRADYLFHKYKNRKKVVGWLCKEFDISSRQAYKDIANCMLFFAGVRALDKHYLRAVLIEDCFKDLEQARQDRDWRSVSALTKLLEGLIEKFENPDRQVRQPKTIVVGNFRELLPYEIPTDFDSQLERLKIKKGISINPDQDVQPIE